MDMSNQYDNSSPLLYLPEEIWIQIFTYLSHGDLQQIKLVSTQWYLLSNAPKLKCKSKLVINYENASEISQFIKNQKRDEQFLRPLQYGNVLMKQIFTYNIDDLDEICKYLRPHVRLLQLTGLYSLGNHFVKHGYFPELQELNLSSAYVGAELDLRKFPKLKSLTLYSSVASLLLVSLETCQRLEKLVLFMDHDFGSFLEVLDKYASSLRCLEIRSPSVLQALDDQEIFKKYIRLEALHIKGPLSADYSHIFQNLPRKNLKTIELEPICNDDLLNLIVTKWSNSLQSLKLHFEKLTQRNAKQLNSISNKLSFLHLEFGGRVNKAFLNGIISETNTKLLALALCGSISRSATRALCSLIQRFPSLILLDLTGCRLVTSDQLLSCIFSQHRLKYVFLEPCISKGNSKTLKTLFSNSSKPNITNLKGLKILRSCICPISVLWMLDLNFKFKELSELFLLPCRRSKTIVGITSFDKYFPSLEKFFVYGSENKEFAKTLHFPRLRVFH